MDGDINGKWYVGGYTVGCAGRGVMCVRVAGGRAASYWGIMVMMCRVWYGDSVYWWRWRCLVDLCALIMGDLVRVTASAMRMSMSVDVRTALRLFSSYQRYT